MAVNFFLTDEDADVQPATGVYKRAKLGSRSDNPSLIRSVTNTAAGPSSGIQITRAAGGTVLAWISDPLSGVDLTAAAWIFHIWAKESAAAANAALRFQVLPFTVAEQASALDDNGGTELGTTNADYARTSGVAAVTVLADGDRLVFKILLDDATALSMAASQTVTMSFNGGVARAEGDSYITCPDTLAVTAALPAATITELRRLLHVAADTADYSARLSDAEATLAFQKALVSYGHDRPRVVSDYLSGDGSAYLFPLPRRWIAQYSDIKAIEYPAGNQIRTLLEPEDWEIDVGATGGIPTRRLRFRQLVPDSGTDNLLVTYTTRHVYDDEQSTLPDEDYQAVVFLAASYAAEQLAARMASSQDSTMQADSVQYRDGVVRFRDIAKAYRTNYDRHINQQPGAEIRGAGYVQDWDTNLSWGGDRIFHARRGR